MPRHLCTSLMYFSIVNADIAAAAVLISMGAVLGRTTYMQLIVMGIIEIAVLTCNFYIGNSLLKVYDLNVLFCYLLILYSSLGYRCWWICVHSYIWSIFWSRSQFCTVEAITRRCFRQITGTV